METINKESFTSVDFINLLMEGKSLEAEQMFRQMMESEVDSHMEELVHDIIEGKTLRVSPKTLTALTQSGGKAANNKGQIRFRKQTKDVIALSNAEAAEAAKAGEIPPTVIIRSGKADQKVAIGTNASYRARS